jgi:hypothetical protein
MIGFKKASLGLGAFAVVCVMATMASAGLLGTGHSYDDGTLWEGTQAFSKTSGANTLSGSVDYAVFTASEFGNLFTGYVATPDELVYTYQIHNSGTVNITLSKLLLLSGATADNPGFFEGDGVSGMAPYASTISGQNVTWDFTTGHNIVSPGESVGLAFSSTRRPMARDINVIVDGPLSVNVQYVAGPGSVPIPEPSSLALLTVAAAAAGIAVVRNRRKEK